MDAAEKRPRSSPNLEAPWMMTPTRIAAVSYLNTIPFIYGIEHGGFNLRAELLLSPPNGCAESLRGGRADISLVPIAALHHYSEAQIITPFCIGACAAVRTVVLAANRPIDTLEAIYLDHHSLTSAGLMRLLAHEFWQVNPQWLPLNDYSLLETPDPHSGYLLIGDKVFEQEGRFTYWYDLSEIWHQHTGLPFAFAVWASRQGVEDAVIEQLESALRFGVEHIDEAITTYGYSDRPYAHHYLTHNIDYHLDSQKRKAIERYWQGLERLPEGG